MSDVLSTPTLVLNKNWQPVHVTTAHRAVVMLWSESAQVVCPDTYQQYSWEEWILLPPAPGALIIRTGKLKFGVPDAVRLENYSGMPLKQVTFNRQNLFKRDHHTCSYCNVQPGHGGLTIDHVVPRSRGGANSWTNCVAACYHCNTKKADKTLDEARMKLRRPPTRPDWKPFYSSLGARVKRWEPFFKTPDVGLKVFTGT